MYTTCTLTVPFVTAYTGPHKYRRLRNALYSRHDVQLSRRHQSGADLCYRNVSLTAWNLYKDRGQCSRSIHALDVLRGDYTREWPRVEHTYRLMVYLLCTTKHERQNKNSTCCGRPETFRHPCKNITFVKERTGSSERQY